jgi:hypothetical protein
VRTRDPARHRNPEEAPRDAILLLGEALESTNDPGQSPGGTAQVAGIFI